MRRSLLAVLLALASSSGSALAVPRDPPLGATPTAVSPADLRRVIEGLKRDGDLAVDYRQETLTLRGTVRLARGSALFARDGGFLWRRDLPSAEQWYFDGRELTRYLPAAAQATVWPSAAPFAQDLGRVIELMSTPEAILEHSDVLRAETLHGDGKSLYLEIVPRRAGDFRKLALMVDEDAGLIRAIELHLASGQVTRFSFHRAKRVRLPAEAFTFKAHDGIIVDHALR